MILPPKSIDPEAPQIGAIPGTHGTLPSTRYTERGESFVPAYLELLRSGGSAEPEALGRIVDCDLGDPAFWSAGLQLIDDQLATATDAARDAGRIPAT